MSERHTGLELLDAMRRGVNYTRVFRVREASVRLRVLSIDEVETITADVAELVINASQNRQTRVSEELAFAKLTLTRASTSDVDVQDAKLNEYILGRMSVGELMKLFKDWNKFVAEVDPGAEEMGADKLQEMANLVKKNPSQLTELSFSELNQVCRFLAEHSAD